MYRESVLGYVSTLWFRKALHIVQVFFCRKTIFQIGFPLQSCQVVQTGAIVFFAFFSTLVISRAAFSSLPLICSALSLEKYGSSLFSHLSRSISHPGSPEKYHNILWEQICGFLLLALHHGKGWGLYPAHNQSFKISRGVCSGSIHSNQPVSLCPAHRSHTEILIFFLIFSLSWKPF